MPPPIADCWAAALRRMTRPMTTITAMTSRPIISMEASSSPKPKCEASAARPRPAARPASGPIHERLGCGCAAPGAACGLAAAGAAAWLGAGAAAGDFCGLIDSRCMPEDEPPPRRLAASASPVTSVKPSTSAADKRAIDFMVVSVQGMKCTLQDSRACVSLKQELSEISVRKIRSVAKPAARSQAVSPNQLAPRQARSASRARCS